MRTRLVIPAAVGLATALSVFSFQRAFSREEEARYLEEVRADVVRELAAVRAAAETALNARIHLVRGLRTQVSVNPDITPDEFAALASNLMEEVDGVRSVTSIRDNVIDDVYPREGNEGAIGLDLLAHPDQRTDALAAIETGNPWLAGPVELAQGGSAFINRAPVYVTEPGGPPRGGRYWGMVSILVDRDTIVREIEAGVPRELRIAVRGRGAGGRAGELFVGDESIFAKNPVETRISLPTGSWRLYGVPRDGWPTSAPGSTSRSVLGAVFSILAGGLAFGVVLAAIHFRDSTVRLEKANAEVRAAHGETERARAELARQAAELARSNSDLEEFARSASHDLRSPLNNVKLLATFVLEDAEATMGDESREHLHLMIQRIELMDRLLSDLLNYSRIGRKESEAVDLDLDVVVADVVEIVTPPSGFEVRVEGRLPTVHAPKSAVERVFLNLVSNAVKHHDRESGVVTVSARGGDDHWEVLVADDGPGIPEEYRDRVFGLFQTLKTDPDSTGIGLASVRKTMETLGGTIDVEPTGGRGATFRLVFPRTPRTT